MLESNNNIYGIGLFEILNEIIYAKLPALCLIYSWANSVND
jgi:hypothetical protein